MTFRTETIGDCTLILGDCLDVLPTLGKVDAVVTDPPYGIGVARASGPHGRANTQRGASLAVGRDYGDGEWDDEPAPEAVEMARSIAQYAIIFGGNYYVLPTSSCWLVWDKENGYSGYADCELAWTNLPKAVRRIRYLWNGCMRRERDIPREHPTQKPVGVMKWCIEHLPADCQTILDPFAGSGTTGVACVQLGKAFIGIEREPKYFEIMCRRIREAYRSPRLELPEPVKPVQEAMAI